MNSKEKSLESPEQILINLYQLLKKHGFTIYYINVGKLGCKINNESAFIILVDLKNIKIGSFKSYKNRYLNDKKVFDAVSKLLQGKFTLRENCVADDSYFYEVIPVDSTGTPENPDDELSGMTVDISDRIKEITKT